MAYNPADFELVEAPAGSASPYDPADFELVDDGRTGLLEGVGNALERGWSLSLMAREMENPQPNPQAIAALQQRMQAAPPSPEYMATMNDKLDPAESWNAFKSAPVKVLAELMGESLSAFAGQVADKAPSRMLVGAGFGAGTAMAAGQAGPQVLTPEEVVTVPAGAILGAGAGFAEASGAASYALEMAGGVLESLEKAGVPLSDPQALSTALRDPQRMQVAREFAERKAVPVAVFDGASAVIGGRMFGGGKVASAMTRLGQGLAETFTQAAMGAAGEASGQLAQSGQITSGRSILAEGVAEVPTGLIEIGAGQLTTPPAAQQPAAAPAPASAAPQPALFTPAPAAETVVVEQDDVFGEATTAAVSEPGAGGMEPGAGDERFAPPVTEQRRVNFAMPDDMGTAPAADMTADVFAGVPRQADLDLEAEIPLGLSRPQTADRTLRELDEDAFDNLYRERRDAIIKIEKEIDEAEDPSSILLNRERRQEYARLGNEYRQAELERYRRNQSEVATGVLFEDMLNLSEGQERPGWITTENGQRFAALAEIIASRTPEQRSDAALVESLRELPARIKGDPNFQEVTSWKMERTREAMQKVMAAAPAAANPELTAGTRTAGPAVPTETQTTGGGDSAATTAAPARAKLNIQRKLRPDSGAIDVSIFEDIVEYGQTVYRAGMEYATWAAAMVREFGQGVAQFLRQAFDRIVAAYRASRFSDTTGAVNVFHGTPHKILASEGFKLTKVGTGEGAAAYGWGLYFAELLAVAEQYALQLSRANASVSIDGKKYDGQRNALSSDVDMLIADAWHSLPKNYRTKDELVQELKSRSKGAFKEWKGRFKEAIAKAQTDAVQFEHPSNLYTVELDVESEQLLDWDEPVSDEIARKIYDLTNGGLSPVPVQMTPEGQPRFVSGRRMTGKQAYESLGVSLDQRTPIQIAIQGPKSQKQRASEALASVGIKGIRYLDQGSKGNRAVTWTDGASQKYSDADNIKGIAENYLESSNGNVDAAIRKLRESKPKQYQQTADALEFGDLVPSPSYNYVIFDESVIRITAENGQPVAQSQVAAYVSAHRKLSAEAGGIDASVLADLVEFGKVVYREGMTLAQWSAQMVKEFGQKAAKFLADAYKQVVAAYQASRFADTTGAVGDVRPRQTKPRQLEEKARRNEALAAETRARLGSEYLPISLNAQAEAAKEWINTNGLDAAKLRIAQLSGEDSVPTPLDFAIGIEAAGRLSAAGDHQGAADVVSTMSHRATGMGQTISTLAMMARLSPEGIVFYGENIIRRYINALPPEAQDRIRALQAEVARLKAELAKAKFDQGSEVIRSGKLGDEKIQDRIKRRQRAKVEADLGPAASGPEVTAETKARTQRMNRAVRDVLLGDATKAEAVKAIEAILLEQGNLSASEAAAMARSIAEAFFKLMRETRTRLTNEARTKALPTKARGFEKLLELLRSGKDVSDAEFTGNVAQLLGLPGMTREMARDLQEIAKRYERSNDPDVRLALAAQMFEMVHEMVPADIWAKVRAWAYLAMLFAPKTWIKNILGNQILWVAHIGRDAFISGIMDPAMSLLTGKRTLSGVQFSKRARALLTPIEDVRRGYLWSKQENPSFNFRQNLAAGVNHLRLLAKLTSQNKFEISDVRSVNGRIFSSKFGRFWESGLSIALGAGDRAFWMAQFRTSLAQMQAAAEKNGEWSGQPTPEMIEAAMAEAAYSIFQNPNVVSKGLNYIRKGLNLISTWGRSSEFGLGTALLAFTQVPGSITVRGLVDWSPLGFIQAMYTGMRGILYASSRGRMGAKFDQAAFNKEFTQALLGTGSLYLLGAWLYSLGIITASREDDDDLEAMRRSSGMGAYRINVTALRRALLSGNWFQRQEGEMGDLVVPYDWAQPLAITLAAGAELAAQKERTSREELKKGAAKPQTMAATIVKLSGTKSLEELPLLSGLSSFMKAWGYGGPVDAVANTVAGMPAMFVPQVVRQWMQMRDNMQRETSAGDPVKREFMKVLASMPGYSTKFPLKFDTMGQAIERYQYGGNNVFNVMLNPAVAQQIKTNPVMQEISRLVDATGQTGMAPKKVDRRATINGQEVELTNNQIAAYQYYLGNFTMAHFTWRMAAPVYARLPDEVKAKMLTDDIQDIDAAVKSAVLGHDPRRLTRRQLFLRNALVNSPLGRSVPPR